MHFKELTHTQRRKYDDTLHNSHFIRVELRIMNSNEKVIGSYTHPRARLLSGSVQINSNAATTRSLDVQLLDPERKLHFDKGSASPHAVYLDRFVSVLYGVWVDDLQDWVDEFVFWGPVTGFNRQGNEVELQAKDPSVLLMAPNYVHEPYAIKEGTKVVDAIKKVAAQMGCRKFDLPDLKHRLTRPYNVHRGAEPWKIITTRGKHVSGFQAHHPDSNSGHGDNSKSKEDPWQDAAGLVSYLPDSYDIYFAPSGHLTMRKKRKKTRFVFKEGVHLVTHEDIQYNMDAFLNAVRVTGTAAKNKKKPPYAEVTVRHNRPESPDNVRWNGVKRYMERYIHAANLHSQKECRQRAQKELAHAALQRVSVNFDAFPVPYLLENDHVVYKPIHGEHIKFVMRNWTLPLTSDTAMTVGRHKKHKLFHRKKKHHHHHHKPQHHKPPPRRHHKPKPHHRRRG